MSSIMDNLLTYIIQVNIVWLALWLLYGVLRGVADTFFALRRRLLLGLPAFAFLFPLLAALWPDGASAPAGWAAEAVWLPAVSVTPGGGTAAGWPWWAAAYAAVAAVLLARVAAGLLAVARRVRRCPEVRRDGRRYFLLPDGAAPFSFFGRIYLPARLERSPHLAAVLAHEAVHARQLHSADLLFMQAACALLWCNPAAWLTLREVRALHEYLADEAAAGQGAARRQYQLTLLAFSAFGQGPSVTVATPPINKFCVLPLKKRIKMMKARRTSRLWQVKYLLLLPAGLCLLALGHSARAARVVATAMSAAPAAVAPADEIQEGAAAPQSAVRTDREKPVTAAPAASAPADAAPRPAVREEREKPVTPAPAAAPDDEIPDNASVSQPAVYKDGETALMKHMAENIHYPADAQEKGVQGIVLVTFVVDKEGRVKDAGVKRSLSPSCDKAALEAVRKLGRFKPARKDGRAVAVRMMLPVAFRLN